MASMGWLFYGGLGDFTGDSILFGSLFSWLERVDFQMEKILLSSSLCQNMEGSITIQVFYVVPLP